MAAKSTLEFHVDPQFVHRQLAAQAFGGSETASLSAIADRITTSVVERQIADIRVTAIRDELAAADGQLITVRSGFYFRRIGTGRQQRVQFHDKITIDRGLVVKVEGQFDPLRFEANSPWDNLSGRKHVFIAGIATLVEEEVTRVILRPVLIGFPYFAPARNRDPFLASNRPEIFCADVDQFRLTESDMRSVVKSSELTRLFSIPEQEVKEAFGTILGLSSVPYDWGGEHSDLVSDLSVGGAWTRAAFAFKGPGGKPKPWTLYPANMGKRGDQAVRLFAEPADVMVVQHCSLIAEPVRHIMDALAVTHQKRYILLGGDNTVRILKANGLFPS